MRKKASKLRNVADARLRARHVLPRTLFDYIDGGADDEVTLKDNRVAYSEVDLLSRAAVFPLKPLLAKTVLGAPLSMPVLLCPCGGVRLVHPDGDRAVARAATAAGVTYAVSTATYTPFEEIMDAATGPLWFQLYFHGGREDAESLVERVQKAGYGALFVTVDSSGIANQERMFRHRAVFPIKKNLRQAVHYLPQFVTRPGWTAGFLFDGLPTTYSSMPDRANSSSANENEGSAPESDLSHPCPVWTDIDWIRRQWKGPLVVKGVLTVADALEARDRGADGIVISNHGGRQLDGVPGTLRTLRDIKVAVGDDLEILIDGGIRRGGDVIKALALGADAAMIGRPYLYGLAASGQSGVARILEIFRADLTRTLGHLGCTTIDEVDISVIDTSRFRELHAEGHSN